MSTQTKGARGRARPKPLTEAQALALLESGAVDQPVDPARALGANAVRRAREACERADADLTEAVTMARALGTTWGDIGYMLRITPQAAHRRYATTVAQSIKAATA